MAAEQEPDEQVRVGDRRPGGRAARVRASVLAAAAELLDEAGYDALSTDEVARRAGVHRTTVYRRWPTKPELVAEAVGLHAEEQIPIPDTGRLHDDLAALAGAVAANLVAGRPATSRSLVAAAATSETLAASLNRFMERRMALSEPIVERAVERGEVPAGTDPRAIIEPVVGAIWFRFLLTGGSLDETFIDAVVEVVAGGARTAAGGSGEEAR